MNNNINIVLATKFETFELDVTQPFDKISKFFKRTPPPARFSGTLKPLVF